MTKNNENTKHRDVKNRLFTKKAAELTGVSVSMAEKVMRMDKHNEQVVTAYMMLNEGFNQLLAEVKRILPEIGSENHQNRAENAIK